VSRPLGILLLLFTCLFAIALARQRLLHTALFARLEIEGVPFYFLNNVFLLYLPLETSQGIFQRLALLYSNFCQSKHPLTDLVGQVLSVWQDESFGKFVIGDFEISDCRYPSSMCLKIREITNDSIYNWLLCLPSTNIKKNLNGMNS